MFLTIILSGYSKLADLLKKKLGKIEYFDCVTFETQGLWRENMEYVTATSDMVNAIYNVLHTTIKTIYAKYYPKGVVDFFCQHHSKEHILDGIASGKMGVLVENSVIVGTGCFEDNHITGVYVLPAYQKQGFGSYIMDYLETEISKKYDVAVLDASLSAVFLYEHRGYKTVGHGIYELENDVKLVYEVMEKKLKN